MNSFTAVFLHSAVVSALAAAGFVGCASSGDRSGDVTVAAEALSHEHPHCPHHVCGDGVVDRDEACDDGNLEDGDGCSAQCELDDVSWTPGDERAGYVTCDQAEPSFTCGPDQGCCAQPNPDGPACAADRSECGQNPTFQACDGPEDCAEDLHCVGTRFGNTCAEKGYYWVCHTDADCDASRPVCDQDGICRAAAVCGDGVLDDDEECDDGNNDADDGCSPDCKRC